MGLRPSLFITLLNWQMKFSDLSFKITIECFRFSFIIFFYILKIFFNFQRFFLYLYFRPILATVTNIFVVDESFKIRRVKPDSFTSFYHPTKISFLLLVLVLQLKFSTPIFLFQTKKISKKNLDKKSLRGSQQANSYKHYLHFISWKIRKNKKS